MNIEFMLVNTTLFEDNTVGLTLKHLEIEDWIKQTSKLKDEDTTIFGLDMGKLTTQVVKNMGYSDQSGFGEDNKSSLILTMTEYEQLGKPTISDIIIMELKIK